MKVLIDDNVILDHLLDRIPFSSCARNIIKLSEDGVLIGMMNASSATDIYYVLRKMVGHERSKEILKTLFLILDIIKVDKTDLLNAMDFKMSDYEDALVASCAKRAKADYIITRNIKDFVDSPVCPLLPDDFINRFFSEV